MSIQTRELPCRSGTLGILTLDSPDTLNALSSSMLYDIRAQLDAWAANDDICLILINANGHKGFCAGGDLREMYRAMQGGPGNSSLSDMLSLEYQVDYRIHTFPKPVITLAHGITFGGGMGLLQASRYRLITPDSVLAMPEAAIGFFPDVGASWFLNRLPGSIGLFMGLTGARLNTTDAMRVGLADMVLDHTQLDTLIASITDQYWSGEIASDDNRLFRLLNQMDEAEPASLPESELARYEQDIARLCRRDELPRVVDRLLGSPAGNDWWNSCIDSLRSACPVSLWLLEKQLMHGVQMSLKDIFRMELVIAANCSAHPDLEEGIRAMLIDRDRNPKWSWSSLSEVPEDYIEGHFVAPWSDQDGPLGDL